MSQLATINDGVLLLSLPQEILYMIWEKALTTDTGEIYLFEEKGNIQVAAADKMPPGGRDKQFEGNIEDLPKAFNQIQNTCQALRRQTRGLELQYNKIVSNGWSFDSFLSQEDISPIRKKYFKRALYDNIRNVTLVGKFKIDHEPDENVLHRLLRFGRRHPEAVIKVRVWNLAMHSEPKSTKPKDKKQAPRESLKGFVSFALCIKEAVRGVERPEWAVGRQGTKWIGKWRRGKDVSFMNVRKVRFFPYDTFDEEKVLGLLKGGAAYANDLIALYGSIEEALAAIKEWYEEGI